MSITVRSLASALALVLPACAGDPGPHEVELASSVEPIFVAGNQTCGQLGYGDFEVKIDPPVSGTYAIDEENGITIEVDGAYVDWSATIGVDAVFVKGGPNGNLYLYDPEATSDEGLHAPINPSNGTPYGLSHVSFCVDYELAVTKTAETSFDRTYHWQIDKAVDQGELLLAAGESYLMGYTVQVSSTGSTDSGWAVSGDIAVHNPAPIAATVTGVTDLIDGSIDVPVDCGVTFPYALAAHATLACTYEAALPDGADRTNVATATTTGTIDGGSGSAAIDFDGAVVNGIDECVDVSDTLAGHLGSACVGDPGLFDYDVLIGPYEECGTSHEVNNTASFLTNDTGASGSDSEVVTVNIADCEAGCTLTQGYWRTHSSRGPAPYDDAWALITPSGADSPFFRSGKSYYQVLWTPPMGNAYYILAKQYIGAVLNGLNGATTTAIQAELDQAKWLFETYTPGQVKGSLKITFINLASALDAWNNGTTGPGHCDE